MSSQNETPRSTADGLGSTVPEFARKLSAFIDTMNEIAHEYTSDEQSLAQILADHFEVEPTLLEPVSQKFPVWRHADLDVAVELVIGEAKQLIGVSADDENYDFPDLLANRYHSFRPGPVEFTSVPTAPDQRRRVTKNGLHLFTYHDAKMALLETQIAEFGRPESRVSVLSTSAEAADELLREISTAMNEHSFLRNQLISFGASEFDDGPGIVRFHPRPTISASEVILPADTLERIERHVLGLTTIAAKLKSTGQHLKRGILLYGPPGTGKTHTVRYLAAIGRDRTIITLSGSGLSAVELAADTARALQPAIVVLEDCDLVAEDRDLSESGAPLLFDILDALDGLAGDSDIAFILTTNRAEALEEALIQRPGRIDLAVEVPLPDEDSRVDLFALYSSRLDLGEQTYRRAAAATPGVTASFVKEAVRRSIVNAAVTGGEVSDSDLLHAVEELQSDAERLTASLLASGSSWEDGPEDDDPEYADTGEVEG